MIWVQRMLGPARVRGEPIDALMADAAIPAHLLGRADATVTGEQYATLFRLVMERLGDESLGFFSRPFKPGSLALLARYAIGAQTLGQAIRRCSHAIQVLQDDLVLRQSRRNDLAGIELIFSNSITAQQPFLHDLLLRILWQFYIWLSDGQLRASHFDLAYPRPPQQQGYSEVFSKSTRFASPHSGVWFDAEWLEMPVRRSEAQLRVYLADAQRNIILPRRFDNAVSTRVNNYLSCQQPLWPGLVETASALNMSTATLQ